MLGQSIQPWSRRKASWQQQERLMGLGAVVEVRTDTWGIHHIFAQQEEDLFRAQGYLTARDRLFQMDMMRRIASGRLSELYGDVATADFDSVLHLRGQGLSSVDYFMRVMGLQEAARDGLSWLSARTHRALLAYSEGVNEYIETARQQGQWPLGYDLLSQEPALWHTTDSLLILRLIGFKLGMGWRLLLSFGALQQHLGNSHMGLLRSLLPPSQTLTIDDNLFPAASAVGKEAAAVSTIESTGQPFHSGTGHGSCAWVISGQHTRSGGPLLCHDPHLSLRLPSSFYQVHLHAGDYDVCGMSVPGTVGVFAGHNAHIAWGSSASRLDDADIYLETLDRSQERYQHEGRYLPLIRREEVIRVRGESPLHRWVRSTVHGPLLSDALRGPLSTPPAYSLAWTGLEGVREAEAMLQLNRATNWESFTEALRHARVPSMSYVYADRKGNIGGIVAGRHPQRNHQPRLFQPLPGHLQHYNWQDDIDFAEHPKALNPASGYLLFAGQAPESSLGPHPLQGFWSPGHRAARIESLLQRQLQKRPGVAEMARLQRDQYDIWARDFIQEHLAPFRTRIPLAPELRSSFALLLDWNGRFGDQSAAAAMFTMFQHKLQEAAYGRWLNDDLRWRWLDIASELESPLAPLFRDPETWFDGDPKTAIYDALHSAHTALQQKLGSNADEWRWHRLHRLTLRPLFFWGGGLQSKFIRGPYGTGGSIWSLNTGGHLWSRPFEHRVGASARQIIDLGAPERSSWVLCGGQHESPNSPHYDDQLNHWRHGDHIPQQSHPAAIKQHAQHWLLPPHIAHPPTSQLSDDSFHLPRHTAQAKR